MSDSAGAAGIDTSEKDLESAIEEQLIASGYRKRAPGNYDRELCLDTELLFDFIFATQPDEWKKLEVQYSGKAREGFLKRLTHELAERKTLDVLRKGIVDRGCKFRLAYFCPETTLNEEHARLYNANITSVIRQTAYSTKNNKTLDLVIFLNGIPILTAELKNPLTNQTVEHAIRQYRYDRDPREPLLAFGRCLAHFAVDPDLVYMTTQLRGGRTDFLPFNKGRDGGAGNPDNPDGFKTAYLWEQVWQRDSLLDIICHFVQVVPKFDDNGRPTGDKEIIFPRYHQLDAVRRLTADARKRGTGQHYLIQHSAGSGKSNTIAWLAHRLAGLHDDNDARVFDSIIVITDRRVLDWQLQRTVTSFEHPKGLISTVTGFKSRKLKDALEKGTDIIVTTLQTFPFVVEKIGALPGKKFAVIVDEAHSSQSGETSKALKEVLAPANLDEAEREDQDYQDEEDYLDAAVEAAMKTRGRLPNLSFFAFTATPKNKTLELFGEKQLDGTFRPFHLYTMRQAIEEQFILDVLKNYTTYHDFFNLRKRIQDDPRYDKRKGTYLLKSYMDRHEHVIGKKTEVMIEHFRENVAARIEGQAKAMIVTRSRLHAVRYRLAFDRYLRQKGYPYKALVAFSGTVKDPDSGAEFTETGMNGFLDTQTADEFKKPEYRFLICANKFQMGFDQKLLHTMYVDKKLGGVNAVQTLSRLNRTYPPHKEDTFVLDFANEADEIRDAFQPYYTTTILSQETDPNLLYDIKRKIEEYHLFEATEVEAFARVYFRSGANQAQLHAILDPVVARYEELAQHETDEQNQADFRKQLGNYVRLYAFLTQIFTPPNAEVEKFYQFCRFLLRKIPVPIERLPVEITENVNLDTYRLQQTSSGEISLINEDGQLEPITDLGTSRDKDDELTPLSEIVQYINDHYGADFTDADKVNHFADDMSRRLMAREGLAQALDPKINPSPENQRLAFDGFFNAILEDMIEANGDLYRKITEDAAFGDIFRRVMFERIARGIGGSAQAAQ